jgi:DNA-binding transcriptional ArsR family regulator
MPTSVKGPVALEAVLYAISDMTRWQVLSELATGEPVMVTELAKKFGSSVPSMSKHLGALRSVGIVRPWRGRLYTLVDALRPQPGKREIDFGHCLLRFG